jgi:lysophospholipase L1-like esterase
MFSARTIIAVVAATYVAFSLSTAMAADTCDRFEELFATTPAPPQNPSQWKFYSERLAAILPGDSDLLLIGDSLAQLWPDVSLSPLRVANLGIGGDSTQHLLWRLASPELSTLKPIKVLIVIGTNNLGTGSQPCAIVAGIRKIIGKVGETWPSAQAAFLEITPRGADFGFNNTWRLETNAAVRLIPGVKTINVDDAITCDWHVPCQNYGDDNLHFSPAGYEIVGKAVKAALFQN